MPRERPSFTLVDTAGAPYDFAAETAGRPTLVFFGYTHCPDICPTTMADVATALRQLGPAAREEVEVVFVTTDPARDTPEVLGDYLGRFDPSFTGLTGSAEQVAAAQEAAGVPLATVPGPDPGPPGPVPAEHHGGHGYRVEHGSAVTAYGVRDREVVSWRPGTLPEDYAADLSVILEEDR